MLLLAALIVLLFAFGGGGVWYRSRNPDGGAVNVFWVPLVVVVLPVLFGGFGGRYGSRWYP